MAYLILVRHGQSEWNALGQWTGLTDVNLTDEGRAEAQLAAENLKDIRIDSAHTSTLKRAKQTYHEISKALKLTHLKAKEHKALDERDYGDLTGKNKWKIKEEYGEEQFKLWRRSWDHPVPGGETLKDVYNRAVPYYEEHIKKDLTSGKNVIVSAHGNTLRALIKYLDKLSNDKISEVEVATGEVHIYEIDDNGHVIGKEVRGHKENKA